MGFARRRYLSLMMILPRHLSFSTVYGGKLPNPSSILKDYLTIILRVQILAGVGFLLLLHLSVLHLLGEELFWPPIYRRLQPRSCLQVMLNVLARANLQFQPVPPFCHNLPQLGCLVVLSGQAVPSLLLLMGSLAFWVA